MIQFDYFKKMMQEVVTAHSKIDAISFANTKKDMDTDSDVRGTWLLEVIAKDTGHRYDDIIPQQVVEVDGISEFIVIAENEKMYGKVTEYYFSLKPGYEDCLERMKDSVMKEMIFAPDEYSMFADYIET